MHRLVATGKFTAAPRLTEPGADIESFFPSGEIPNFFQIIFMKVVRARARGIFPRAYKF